jgi:deazaflavin-dependent oxidoreductase (nitroreductase family)
MPLNRSVARFNRVFANHIVGPIFRRMPGFGAIHHRGRRSGREYVTPVKIFQRGDDYVITLPYGHKADWVRNVLADGGCVLETRGKRVPLTSPRLQPDEGRTLVPAMARWAMARLGSTVFLVLSPRQDQHAKGLHRERTDR